VRERLPVIALGAWMAVVLAGAVWYVLGIGNFFIQPDELTWNRAAMGIADLGRPILPSDPWFNSYAQLTPVLLAPVYVFVSDTTTALDVGHVVLAVVFVSAAIPTYLLARRVSGSRWLAAVVAALTITIPWLVTAGGTLTEPAAYAAFCWALLGMVVAVERRDARGDLLGLAGIALAFSSRTQFVLLGPALIVAVLVHDLRLGHRVGDILRAHAVLAITGAVAAVALLAQPTRFLGSYGIVRDLDYPVGESLSRGVDLLASVVVGIGAIPLALALAFVLLELHRPSDAPRTAFAAVAASTGVILFLGVGAFASAFIGRHDRYLMYLVPILFLGTLLLLIDRRRAVWPLAVGGLATAWLCTDDSLLQHLRSAIAPGEIFRPVLIGRSDQIAGLVGIDNGITVVIPVAVLLAVGAIIVARRRGVATPVLAAVVAAVLMLYGTVATGYSLDAVRDGQSGASEEFIAMRDWVDETVPDGEKVNGFVGLTFDPGTTVANWWETRHFNRSVDRIYLTEEQFHYHQPFYGFVRVRDDGRVEGMGGRRFMLVAENEARLVWRGARVVRTHAGLALLEVPFPYQLVSWLPGVDAEGRLPADGQRELHVFGDGRPGRRIVTMTFGAALTQPGRGQVTAQSGSVRRTGTFGRDPVEISVPVELPARGSARIALRSREMPGAARILAVRVERP